MEGSQAAEEGQVSEGMETVYKYKWPYPRFD